MALALQAEEPEPAPVAGAVAADHGVRRTGARHGRGRDAEAEGRARVPAEDEDADAEERGGHHLPRAALLAREERRCHPARERHPGDVIPHGAALVGRVAARRRQRRGDAGARPEGADVVGRPVAVGAALAVAGDARVDEARVAGAQPRVVETERLEDLRPHVGHEHVRAVDELARDAPAVLGAEVERDAPLAAVVELEGRVGGQLGARHGEIEAAERIPVGRLDLHHLRAPVGEHAARRGAGDPEPELDHPHACHRSGHQLASARRASTSATCLGAAADSTSRPPSVTSTSSSMRMPTPR